MSDQAAAPLKPSDTAQRLRLAPNALRWQCDPASLGFETTADVEPLTGVIGQDDAIESLRFGLEIYASGQNIYVRGLTGTGRLMVVSRLLTEIHPACPLSSDYAYVHNFLHRDQPRLLTLPRGKGQAFQDRVTDFIEFVREDLRAALSAESTQGRRDALDARLESSSALIIEPFEKELKEKDLVMVNVRVGKGVQPAMMPLVDGTPAPLERLQTLQQEGKLDEAALKVIQESLASFSVPFNELGRGLRKLQRGHADDVRDLYREEARTLLQVRAEEITDEFDQEDVRAFLGEVVTDVAERRLRALTEDTGFTRMYEVNLVLGHGPKEACPIIAESTPTLPSLFGTIEREILPGGQTRSDHSMITGGSLLNAQGGYLLLEASDLLREPGAWKALVRSLRSRLLNVGSSDSTFPWGNSSLKPEPIPLAVKIILIGDPGLYHALDAGDPDFPHLFKVLADFDDSIVVDAKGLSGYAGLFSRIAKEEKLPPFECGAIAALAEHGARIAARRDRLTTRFGRLVDIAREAAFLANKGTGRTVSAEDVRHAVRRTRRRADLPARRYREYVSRGTIRIETTGKVVGQVNGLAVISTGPLTYGFPSRITATIGPGTAGAINIERESELSGSIHTKGFFILRGLLRHLLKTDHPLAFTSSLAFEQSYGGIDGDSASGAEICCLLSALSGVPLRQDLAMTGAIDQFGSIQPIGAATEKIEGYFDTCVDLGLTGTQGVIIPQTNVENLMLRPDIVEACERGEFHVHAVGHIREALEIFTGVAAGVPDESGVYEEGTLLHLAMEKAFEYWLLAARPATEWLEEGDAPETAIATAPEDEPETPAI